MGAELVWAGFYAKYDAEDHTYSAADTPRTKHGFRVKVLWVMAPAHKHRVSVTASNMDTGAPVFFGVEDLAHHDVAVNLDPPRGGDWRGGMEGVPFLPVLRQRCLLRTQGFMAAGFLASRFGLGR